VAVGQFFLINGFPPPPDGTHSTFPPIELFRIVLPPNDPKTHRFPFSGKLLFLEEKVLWGIGLPFYSDSSFFFFNPSATIVSFSPGKDSLCEVIVFTRQPRCVTFPAIPKAFL